MAKRRADDILLHDSPSKRCYRSLYSVDMQLQSVLPAETVSQSQPSLLDLLDRRCRKRPYYFENPDKDEEIAAGAGSVYHKSAHCDTRKRGAKETSQKKRPREDIVCPNTTITKAKEIDADTNTEDCTYNSFQYWRAPLPKLDLSLLEDACDHSQAKYKDSCSEVMET